MRYTKKYFSITLIFILLTVSFGAYMIFSNKPKNGDTQSKETIQTAESIERLSIDGNGELASHPKVTGSGTWVDPYVIENYEITGSLSGSGIDIRNTNKPLIIQNCTVEKFEYGIYLSNVSNIDIFNNTMISCGIYVRGDLAELLSNKINQSNAVNGNPVYFYKNQVELGKNDFANAGQVILVNCTDSVISNLSISDGSIGINLLYSSNNTLTNNTALYNGDGIYLYYSDNNTLINNTASDNHDSGIRLELSHDNLLTGNIASYNNDGVWLNYSDNNTLINNTASYNYDNIWLYYSNNNTVTGNTASRGSKGIYLSYSDNNTVTGNIALYNNDGIYLFYSDNNTVMDNTASNNNYGISLRDSGTNMLFNNTMISCGIYVHGTLADILSNQIDQSNTVNGKPVYFYKNQVELGGNDFANAGQVILVNCTNSVIFNLSISDGTIGINLLYSNNNTLTNNTALYNSDGIQLEYSHNNVLTGNTVSSNSRGIDLLYSDNNTLMNNIGLNTNRDSIRLQYSHNNVLMGNTVSSNNYGIAIWDSENNEIFSNIMISCGIWVVGGPASLLSNKINQSNTVNGKPVYFYKNQVELGGNDFVNAGQVILVNCTNSIVTSLNFSDGSIGILLFFSTNNTLTNNFALNNNRAGIYLWDSDNNTITNNTALNNYRGIKLVWGSNNNMITGNTLSSNTKGIYLSYSYTNTVTDNIALYNNEGISLSSSDNNTVTGNTVSSNTKGIDLLYSDTNLLFKNNFTANDENAIDAGTSNQWDNGSIGNYWDDYSGFDLNDDGIGDSPYNILGSAGSQDNYPIWTDNIYMNIINPNQSNVFGLNAPHYTVEITYPNLDTMWYSLNGGQSITFTSNDTINQAVWDSLPGGIVSITFYANNTAGNIASKSVEVIKDTIAPMWNPEPKDQTIEFGTDFSYNIDAEDLSTITYSINDTLNFQIDSTTGQLTNNTVLSVGVYWLQIYVNDMWGNVNSIIIMIKVQPEKAPTWNPEPTDQTIEFRNTFSYNVNASDLSGIGQYWINDTLNFQIGSTTGLITNKTVLFVGEYWLQIYVNDTLGNENSTILAIMVQDTRAPTWNPKPTDQTIEFGTDFSYNIDAEDLSTITYSINNTLNFQIDSATGQLTNKTVLFVGEYWLQIYVHDTLGNENSTILAIMVQDTTAPTWNPKPTDQTIEFGTDFSYNIDAEDLSTITYSINNTLNFQIDSATGQLTSNIMLSVGEYWLQINVNDIYGNTISTVIKITVEDTTDPSSPGIPSYPFIIFLAITVITLIGLVLNNQKKTNFKKSFL